MRAVAGIHDIITSSSLGKEKIQMLSLSPKEISKANLYRGNGRKVALTRRRTVLCVSVEAKLCSKAAL